MTGLRERRHAQTRADLVAAAFDLFARRGFAAVTMEEISSAAGVSRSTAYRRFPTKEDVVLEIPRRWLNAYDDAVAELADDLDFEGSLRLASLAVAAHIDGDLDLVRTAYRILDEAPSLNVAGVATTAWLQRVAELARTRGGLDDEAATIVAGAYLGGLDAMMFHWAATGGRESVTAATERTHALMRPMLL